MTPPPGTASFPLVANRDAVLDLALQARSERKETLYEMLVAVAGTLSADGFAVGFPVDDDDWAQFLAIHGAFGKGLKLLQDRQRH